MKMNLGFISNSSSMAYFIIYDDKILKRIKQDVESGVFVENIRSEYLDMSRKSKSIHDVISRILYCLENKIAIDSNDLKVKDINFTGDYEHGYEFYSHEQWDVEHCTIQYLADYMCEKVNSLCTKQENGNRAFFIAKDVLKERIK
jgi:hypothetical protein